MVSLITSVMTYARSTNDLPTAYESASIKTGKDGVNDLLVISLNSAVCFNEIGKCRSGTFLRVSKI